MIKRGFWFGLLITNLRTFISCYAAVKISVSKSSHAKANASRIRHVVSAVKSSFKCVC